MILMQVNSTDLTFLVGNEDILNSMPDTPVLPAFSEEAISFLSVLSRKLLKDKVAQREKDIAAYAYWIRKASLNNEKSNHTYQNRLGRGVAFHIAPSNVPINFAVSMTSSFLAIKYSSKFSFCFSSLNSKYVLLCF